jgi:hypothetical protein
MTGREAAEQQEGDEATATRRRAVEAQVAHDEGKRWQASMLADLRLQQSQRDSQQSLPNDPSPSGMHSPLLHPRARTSREAPNNQPFHLFILNASGTSSDSDSASPLPRHQYYLRPV